MEDFTQMDRRALMRNVALLLGAATVPTLAGCKAAMDGKGSLGEDQLAVLTAIADTIIPKTDTPGAVAVKVPQILDGMLANWASKDTRAKLVGVIDAVSKLGGGFAALDPAKRKAALLPFDAEALKPGPPPKKQHVLAMMMGPPVMNPDYVQLKSLIINLYYASEEAGAKELVYEHNPGKYQPSIKITPESRPPAGVGGTFG
jgi:gluconate 2-dehydrogenase gamma chain